MNSTRPLANASARKFSRRAVLRGAAGGAMGASAATILAACGGNSSTTPSQTTTGSAGGQQKPSAVASGTVQPRRGGSITVPNSSDLQMLDFQQTISTPAQEIACMVFNGLMRFDPTAGINVYKIKPDLAESWEQTADKVIFHLRKDVKWQDTAPMNGRGLVAEDVRFSLERSRTNSPQYVWSYKLTSVGAITAPDDYTLVLDMTAPSAVLLSDLAHGPGMGVVPPEVIQQDGDLNKRWVGTGAFMLTKYVQGQYQQLERNPNYFLQPLPYLDSVKVQVIKDSSTALASFLSGQIAEFEPLQAQVSQIESSLKIKVARYLPLTSSRLNYAAGPTGPKEMKDIRVRQAIDCAIDRDAIVSIGLGGDGVWGGPIIPPHYGAWSMSDDAIKKAYAQNLTKAKQLLSAAGVDKLSIPLDYSNVDTFAAAVLPLVKQDLAKVGIDVQLTPEERTVYLANEVDAKFVIQCTGSGVSTDPDGMLTPYFHTGGGKNWAKISDPKLDERIDKERATLDEGARLDLVHALNSDWKSDFLYRTELADAYGYTAWAPNVHDGFIHTQATFRPMEGVWLS